MSPLLAHSSRVSAAKSVPGWADKTDELLVKKPVYLRGWFRKLMLVVSLVIVATSAVVGAVIYRWHRTQQADLARQRRSLEVFVRSAAFESFAREMDAHFVATLNFAVLRPGPVGRLLPDLAATEKARHELPWAMELLPLPVSTAEHPARVRMAMHTAMDLLARRGFVFDKPRIADARRVFLRVMTPHARAFLAAQPDANFPALFLDPGMQDVVLTAYAARAGSIREEAERALVVYTLVGPLWWQEQEGRRHRGT